MNQKDDSRMWLVRLIGWIAMWQTFTPIRSVFIDFPVMVAGFLILEFIWDFLRK